MLSGDGPSFSAGADVEWMRSSVELSYDENVADALRLRAMLDAIDGCPAPVVARVQGHALGGGVGLVACCDIVVADPEAQFAFSEVKLGIVPAVISPFALAKIGPSAARRYFVTGERFDAETALRIGLVHEVAADLDGTVERVVGELLERRPDRNPHRKGSRPRTAVGRRDGAPDRRAADEPQRARRACKRSSRSAGPAGAEQTALPDERRRLRRHALLRRADAAAAALRALGAPERDRRRRARRGLPGRCDGRRDPERDRRRASRREADRDRRPERGRLCTALFGFADSAWQLDSARFVQGLASAFSWTGAFAWLVARSPPAGEER